MAQPPDFDLKIGDTITIPQLNALIEWNPESVVFTSYPTIEISIWKMDGEHGIFYWKNVSYTISTRYEGKVKEVSFDNDIFLKNGMIDIDKYVEPVLRPIIDKCAPGLIANYYRQEGD
ncbi:MAG: hypothetical protein AAB966_03195, partial [Patescibacteria group bacterium]